MGGKRLISLAVAIKCKSAKKEDYGTCQINCFHIRMRQIVVNPLRAKIVPECRPSGLRIVL